MSRVARLSGLAGVAHVLVSVVLGAVVIAIGLQLRSAVQSDEDAVVGGILIATGVAFALMEMTGHSHGHGHGHKHAHDQDHGPDHSHGHGHNHGPDHSAGDAHSHRHEHGHGHAHRHGRDSRLRGLAGIVVPFGAAASPDLTILPVFLAATAAGTATAVSSVVVFAGATIGTIVGLTLVACFGGYQVRGAWLERWGNALTAVTLIVIGALVATGAI